MKTLLSFSAFLLLITAQFLVPASMIWGQEKTLKSGVLYKFRCAPIDPADPFRGRYVALSVEENSVSNWKGGHVSHNQRVCAVLATGEDGFAKIQRISLKPPKEGDYIQVRIRGYSSRDGTIYLRLPIARFYMNEYQAPKAERAYQRLSNDEEDNVYVAVRVRKGSAVIEDLFIGDSSIRNYLQESR